MTMRRTKRERKLTLRLPDEFIALCQRDQIAPKTVLRGFIGDLCALWDSSETPRTDGYCNHGSSEREKAQEYYDRVGYRYRNQ